MVNEIKTIEQRKESLLKRGSEKGFITYEEMANELKGLELDSDSLDDLYNSLVDAGIEIVSEDANDTSLDLFLLPVEEFINKFEKLKTRLGTDFVDKLGEDSSLIEIMYE